MTGAFARAVVYRYTTGSEWTTRHLSISDISTPENPHLLPPRKAAMEGHGVNIWMGTQTGLSVTCRTLSLPLHRPYSEVEARGIGSGGHTSSASIYAR